MVSSTQSDIARTTAEYQRRGRELPADFYSWARPGNLFQDQTIGRACIRLLRDAHSFPLGGLRIADIGCGSGSWLLEFLQWGADPRLLAGIDLMPDRLERAQQRILQADLRQGNAGELPWPSESFHLVSQFVMFTSVLDDALKRRIAAEMLRVVKPGGAILWVDFRANNPGNPNVRGIGKNEIHSLFPDCAIRLEPVLLAPPISRFLAPRAWALAELLHTVPFLRTHYAGLIRKK